MTRRHYRGCGRYFFGIFNAIEPITDPLFFGFLGREDGILDLDPLLLDSVQETPGPDEFRGKQRQAEADRDPARSRGDQHHHAEKKERETYHDFEKTLHLLDGSQKHREPVPANSTVEGCINLSIYPGIRRR